jgi:hypothetical protein
LTRNGRQDTHSWRGRVGPYKDDAFQHRNEQRAKARRRKIMNHTEIANRFAAFFGGRPVGSLAMYEGKPDQLAREQERDREILAFVAEICGKQQN